MRREAMLDRATTEREWDLVVIGGGASGLGIAVDAAQRGYSTLLLEQHDFAKATSSRSTKLVHGGVRYLRQGNISLVVEALHERGVLYRNAPHLVNHLAFVVPRYRWWEGPFYGIGLKLYDVLAGRLNLARSRLLNRRETLERIPNVEESGLDGGVMYYDAQFDDARMAWVLARTAAELGAVVLNYAPVIALRKTAKNVVEGVVFRDAETGREHEITARVVVNAAGIFADEVRRMDDPSSERLLAQSQGIHLVLDGSFLAGDAAIMVPQTEDGRVLFVIPWLGRALVGTTDTPVPEPQLEPRALDEEVEFVLRNAARYLERDPGRSDVRAVFAGLRPLFGAAGNAKHTKSISREHEVVVSESGLVTIVGGKWTTYRKMAADTVDVAAQVGALPERPCRTEELPLHGWVDRQAPPEVEREVLRPYGSDGPAIEALVDEDPALGEPLDPRFPYIGAQVVWAVRHEMARTVEDVLARRTRALFLDAEAATAAAAPVAALMRRELGRDAGWEAAQVEAFRVLAAGYRLGDP